MQNLNKGVYTKFSKDPQVPDLSYLFIMNANTESANYSDRRNFTSLNGTPSAFFLTAIA